MQVCLELGKSRSPCLSKTDLGLLGLICRQGHQASGIKAKLSFESGYDESIISLLLLVFLKDSEAVHPLGCVLVPNTSARIGYRQFFPGRRLQTRNLWFQVRLFQEPACFVQTAAHHWSFLEGYCFH